MSISRSRPRCRVSCMATPCGSPAAASGDTPLCRPSRVCVSRAPHTERHTRPEAKKRKVRKRKVGRRAAARARAPRGAGREGHRKIRTPPKYYISSVCSLTTARPFVHSLHYTHRQVTGQLTRHEREFTVHVHRAWSVERSKEHTDPVDSNYTPSRAVTPTSCPSYVSPSPPSLRTGTSSLPSKQQRPSSKSCPSTGCV